MKAIPGGHLDLKSGCHDLPPGEQFGGCSAYNMQLYVNDALAILGALQVWQDGLCAEGIVVLLFFFPFLFVVFVRKILQELAVCEHVISNVMLSVLSSRM